MKNNSILKIVFKIVYGIFKAVILGFLVLFAITVCMQRFSNNSVALFDNRLFSVVTKSMAPKYNIGDVLLCREVDVETLVVGDDISYLGKDGTYAGKVITHRIIKIEKDENGELVFYTKGIAANKVDPPVKADQVFGKVTGQVPILSSLYKFIGTPKGFYMAIFVPLVLLIGSEVVVTMIEKAKDKKKKALEEKGNEADKTVDKKEETKKEAKEETSGSDEDKKKAEIKAEIERIENEIAEKKRIEEEKKKAAIKEEIERLQKELEEKNKSK